MTLIRGGPAGPDGLGGSFQQGIKSDRAALWDALGGQQGVLKGFTHSVVPGQMALDFTPGSALLGERADDGTASLPRGYHVWTDDTTRVQFNPASAAARNDAVVVAFVDVEEGPVGTGGLEVGPHLVVVPGVSGITTPRTDADITSYLGRGGWVRLIDVPVAPGETEINAANISRASNGVVGERQVVVKATQESVANSAALQPDDELWFIVGAGGVYRFDIALRVIAGAGDLKIALDQFNAFAQGTVTGMAIGPATSIGSTSEGDGQFRSHSYAAGAPLGDAQFGGAGGAVSVAVRYTGVFTCTASGRMGLKWAQVTANAQNTTIMPGSVLMAERIA